MTRSRTVPEAWKNEEILKALEDLAEKLSVRIRYDELKAFEFRVQDGGCTVKGESQVFIDRKKRTWEKVQILARELEKFDLDSVYVPPFLREKVFVKVKGSPASRRGPISERAAPQEIVPSPEDER